jgi:hypothetical protein
MKAGRAMRTLVMVLIGSVVAGALGLAGLWGFSALSAQGERPAPAVSAYHFDGIVEIDPQTTFITGAWRVTLDQPETETLTYWLSENLEDVAVSGPGLAGFELAPDQAPPGIVAVIITLNSQANAPRVFDIYYSGILLPEPMPNAINSISPELVEFTVDSFWQPFDARFDQGVTGRVSLEIDGDWTPVSTGEARVRAGGVDIDFDTPTRDFPITLLAEHREIETPGYRVLDTRLEAHDLTDVTNAVGACTDYLNDRFGAREPLPQATIVIHGRQGSGYARDTVIALTDIGERVSDDTFRFICHELSHFWASNGNPLTVENWLNESFAEYIGVMAVREARGEDAADAMLDGFRDQVARAGETPPIWLPGATDRSPYMVNYRKGPLALAALEERIGREAFAEFMRRAMVDRIATTPELLGALEDVAGDDHRAWFEARLAQ